MSETISDNEVNILGYDIVRRDRTTVGGEGVCFHEKKSVTFTVRNDLNIETLEKKFKKLDLNRLLSSGGTDLLILLLVSFDLSNI